MKLTIKTEIIPILLILMSIIASFYFYNNFPEKVPTHWNINGEVDGWSSRGFGAFFLPILLIGMYILFLILPKIDPKKERYAEFGNIYHLFRVILIVFLAFVYFATSFVSLGYNIPIGTIIPAGVGLLFMFIGIIMPKLKSNWFVGIRTPWTLSSEDVWEKTHKFGGKVFIFSGILLILSGFVPPKFVSSLFIFAILFILIGTIGYSYFIYKNKN